MAVTYSTTVKNARMTAVSNECGSSGKLEICTAGYASILATINLNATAGTISGGVLTLSGFPKTVSAGNTGTAAIARIRTGANADVITGLTVGTSGSDINLDNTSINSGQNVTINSAAVTHAA
jgi:hypothetical protein